MTALPLVLVCPLQVFQVDLVLPFGRLNPTGKGKPLKTAVGFKAFTGNTFIVFNTMAIDMKGTNYLLAN